MKLRTPSYKLDISTVEPWKDSKTPYRIITALHTAVRHHSYRLSHGQVIIITLLGVQATAGQVFFLTIIFQSWTEQTLLLSWDSALLCTSIPAITSLSCLPSLHIQICQIYSVFLNEHSLNSEQQAWFRVHRWSKNQPAISLSLVAPLPSLGVSCHGWHSLIVEVDVCWLAAVSANTNC